MKNRVKIFFLYLLCWYSIFVFSRIAFLITYFEKSSQLTVYELLSTFFYGFKIDIAIASYIVFLPSLLLSFTSFTSAKFIKYFFRVYTIVALFICCSIILGDLFLYGYWGFRIDATPLFYMTNLKAVTASVSTLTVIGGILAIVLLEFVFYLGFSKLFSPLFDSLTKNYRAFLILFPATLLLGVVMRGGIGIASLTTSTAYFSKKQFANHAAINPVWNVGFSITESEDLQRKYVYYNETEMTKILVPLKSDGTVVNLLRIKRPNIILIITESLTAKAMEATGGRKGVMPELNALVSEGVLFDQIYAASDRTDKGIAAVIAGYPSLPNSSALKYQKLTEKLASIPKKLSDEGYNCEFFYGGTLEFANYRSFLVQAGFDKLISDKDFPKSEMKTKWGAFDHVVLNRFMDETPDSDSGFFKTILTLTSHEPFNTPDPPVFRGNDNDTKYMNSLHYTDRVLGEFIREAKTRKWWKNTLVVIIADHGSRMPGNSEMWDKKKYHIPMIWLGGALKVSDTVVSSLASQTDLAATLLAQLEIETKDFNFSRNILTPEYIPFSFFTFNNGFGFQKPDKLLIYSTVTDTFDSNISAPDAENEKQGKAYLQSLYLDGFNKNK